MNFSNMSKWPSPREEGDVFGDDTQRGGAVGSCGYVVHIPPPVSGPSLPSSPLDVACVSVPDTKWSPDTTRRAVLWYQVLVCTTGYQWGVLKRFSEFVELAGAIEKTGLGRLARRLGRKLEKLPSRFSLRHRRAQVQKFLDSLLQTLKDLSVLVATTGSEASTGRGGGEELSARTRALVTRAAFASFLRFLTTSSHDAMVESGDSEASVASHQLVMDESGRVPPAKIIHVPKQLFTIMLHLPGVSMSDVFVDSAVSADDLREVIVSGSWNSDITGPASALKDAIDSTRSDAFTDSNTTDVCSACDSSEFLDSFTVLMDTFPTGDFQMNFEVPPPFAVEEWKSEYVAGVLFLTWRHGAESSA